MNKIQVDPRLFITCRLCLEDLGIYQIDPAVKEQISYCFEIKVEPFDGLPQLICKKCEAILNNYSLIKKTIVDKQNELKNKIQGSHNSELLPGSSETVGSSRHLEFESNSQNVYTSNKRGGSVSSSSSDSKNDEFNENDNEDFNENKVEGMPKLLENYTKHYACRMCSSRWLDIKSLRTHIGLSHTSLKKKYSHIFKKHCKVKLHLVDRKLNVIGSRSKVMHSREKIIQNVNPEYYILYTTKDNKENERQNYEEHNLNSATVKINYCDDSDSSGEMIVRRKRIRRICSNETVVLDSANKSNLSDNDKESHNTRKVQSPEELDECINIDDSSESEPENSNKQIKTEKQLISEISNEKQKPNQTTISDVITSCQNRYIKKNYHENLIMKSNKSPSEIATQLKRKILSIGRKIINKKKNVNCTPLLRFMEHKNLDIAWIPRLSIAFINQESNYVRIMTRLKNIGENVDTETGWTDYTSTPNLSQEHIPNTVPKSSKRQQRDNFVIASPRELNNSSDVSNGIEAPSINSEIADAVLSTDANPIGTDTKKILNKNPVANPKQLPKKPSSNDMKILKVIAPKEAMPNVEDTPQENSEIDFTMPIITSTTSLAVPFLIPESSDGPSAMVNSKDDKKSEVPRIKVKPVSELMSAETLNRMQEPKKVTSLVNYPMTIQEENNIVSILMPQITTSPMLSQILTSQPNVASNAPEPVWKNEFMILNTTELPNTRTNSPFNYFRRLLQLHNIILLDTDVELTTDFNCLIKFKVMYKQEITNQPVILCLSLFCTKNIFCMKVKDRNQDNINLSKISPNWQWEVLKIYKGEVVSKLLNNARKIGQEVYEFTNSFMCILKSITLVKT